MNCMKDRFSRNENDASSFKQKDQIAEMTVSAKSGVGGYGLLLLPKGQKAGKDDVSDKSKDRIWAGQSPAYGDDDNFYYRKKEQPKDREQVDTDDSSSTSKSSKGKKWNTRSDSEVKSSKKADKNDYPGYTDAQVEGCPDDVSRSPDEPRRLPSAVHTHPLLFYDSPSTCCLSI